MAALTGRVAAPPAEGGALPPGCPTVATGRRARRAAPLTIAIAVVATPAAAATFGELAAWCAPADTGGRPLLCAAYLDAGLGLLASPDRAAAGDARACVPAGEDPARVVRLLEDYAGRHPASRRLPGAAGLGLALAGRYACG